MSVRRRFSWASKRMAFSYVIVMTTWGCGSDSPARPSIPQDSATPNSITGSERIGWSQVASSLSDANGFHYVAYVDGLRTALPDAVCQGGEVGAGFGCS